MPPPIAPADSICIIMKPGNTTAMPVSASVPRCETHQVSISPVEACASITRTLGHAICSSVGSMRPCSSISVRGLRSDISPAATTVCGGLCFITVTFPNFQAGRFLPEACRGADGFGLDFKELDFKELDLEEAASDGEFFFSFLLMRSLAAGPGRFLWVNWLIG